MGNIGIRKIYIKQAIQMLKQNKFMSIIAILGTALAIMMIMTIIVSEEVKNISVAPEVNRYRTFYLNGFIEGDTIKGYSMANSGSIKYEIIHRYLEGLKEPELVSVCGNYNREVNVIVNTTGQKESFALKSLTTDANYWKLYSFSFLQGRPYTEEEFQSGIPYIVLSESKAQELFKGEDAIGRSVELYKKEYQVIGVVKDVSQVFNQAYGEVWLPYTSMKKYEDASYIVALLGRNAGDYPAIAAEIRSVEKKYGTENGANTLYIRGPFSHREYVSDIKGYSKEEIEENINVMYRKRVLILAILLLVPALNLSGISLSRIKKRTTEVGVRKAFGAKKYVILMQVLYENFITSLIGGVLGLILSYMAVYQLKGWLLKLPDDTTIPGETLISPFVFVAVFLVCLVVNLLSTGLPAYRASRMTIINSINDQS